MAIEAERLVIDLEARTSKLEADMRRASGVTDREFRKIGRQADLMQAKIKGIGANFGRGLGISIAGVLGVESVRQIADYAAKYRDLQNALKVTGLQGDALKGTFSQLTQIALKQGAPLDALVTLYSRASQAGDTLHASQGDLIQFSDGVATALRVAGTSAGEAKGALLQLSQALGSGVVHAEEFNSVNEGARPILQAVANGLKEAGGSVSTLRTLVLAGKVSSEAFFRAFLAGTGDLQAQAARAQGTVSQSMERIGTAMMLLFGHLDEVSGASDRATHNLNAVADVIKNLPAYIDAAARGLDSLNSSLAGFGNSPIFKKINDFLGLTNKSPQELAGYGITPTRLFQSTTPDNRIANAFDVTSGTGAAEFEKGGRVFSEGATTAGDASKKAAVSINDYAAAAANAAAKTKSAFPDGGPISDYVKNVIGAESGGKAGAKNPNSSATGLGQFIESTWLQLFKENFPDRAASMSRETILALRSDAEISKQLIEAYAKQNADVLRTAGVSVNEAALHLSHFLGAGDAVKVLKAASGTPLAGLISPASIQANPTILGGGKTVDDAIAYAQRRADSTRIAAGNLTDKEQALQDQSKAYQDLINDSVRYIATQDAENSALGRTKQETAALRYEQELLNKAAEAGITVTPAQAAQFKQLAAAMAEGDAAARAFAQSQREVARAQAEFNDLAKDAIKGVISDLRDGKSAGEIFANVLDKIANKLVDISLDALFPSKGGGVGGSIFSALGHLFGFASGGYTGAGGKYQPAGIVHKGEYVIPKSVVDKVGPKNLGALFNGYADGGLVASPVPLSAPQMNARSAAEVVHIRLQDDSGRMADIADQQIRTRSGDIVRISVDQSLKQGSRKFPRQQADQQRRTA